MKNVIVFGATGSIGAYLVDYLSCKFKNTEYHLIACGRKKTDFFSKLDIDYRMIDLCNEQDFDNLPDKDIYAIVHLAGLVPAYLDSYDPYAYIDVNITGSIRILEYARKVKCDRILYTQTWSDLAGYWENTEVLSPYMPRKLKYTGDHAFYSITKCMILDTMEYYKQEYGIKNFVFRLPNVYLYHPDKYYHVNCEKKKVAYRYMIDQAKKGADLEIWGDPHSFKDVLYIKDLCELLYCGLIANVDGGIYNAGTGIKVSLEDQIKGIAQVFNPSDKKSNFIYKPDMPKIVNFVMDINNAKKELGYSPHYSYLDYLEDYKLEEELKRFDELWIKS